MLDIGTAKVDRCVITQAITKTTLVGFEHALEIVSLFKMDLGWEKDIYTNDFRRKLTGKNVRK